MMQRINGGLKSGCPTVRNTRDSPTLGKNVPRPAGLSAGTPSVQRAIRLVQGPMCIVRST